MGAVPISCGGRPHPLNSRGQDSSVSHEPPNTDKMGDHILLDLEEWSLVLNKMLRFHFNISEEIKAVVQAIRTEMKPELIPLAEEKSTFGKMDLDNLDVDFIEDMMLKAKPLQSVLNDIRGRQITKLEDIKAKYGEAVKDLDAMVVTRPPKPEPKPAPPAEAPAPAPEAAKA